MKTFRWWRPIASVLLIALVALLVRIVDKPDGVWVTNIDSLNEEGVIYVPDLKLFVVAKAPRPLALSAIDPHLGHRDLYCRSAQMFQGIHGEWFDRLGFYYGGPAPRGLDRLRVHMDSDDVYVDPEEPTKGPPRGAGNPEPAGPLCPEEASEGSPGFVSITGMDGRLARHFGRDQGMAKREIGRFTHALYRSQTR